MPNVTHPDRPQPVSTHPGPGGPRHSNAALAFFTVLLALQLYVLAQLPAWPLVLAALALVVLVLVADEVRAPAAAQREQAPRHHRVRDPRGRRRRDPRAALVVSTPWELA